MDIWTLSRNELLDLKAKIEFRLSLLDTPKSNSDIFYKCLIGILKQKIGGKYTPEYQSYSKGKGKFTLKIKEVADYLEEFLMDCEPNYKHNWLPVWYKLYIQLVIERLEELNWVINMGTILNMYELYPGILNKAYPSYVENGWIGAILK